MSKYNVYNGDVKITKENMPEWQKKLKKITKITGDLSISSNVKLEALKSVGGYLSIYSNVKLEALKSVGGYLSISSNVKLEAPQLKSVGGYLSIYSNVKLEALKSVGGDLSISSNVKLEALKSVGGYLSIYSNVKLEAPQLKSVGGDLSIYSNVKLEAPQLKSVGGYLSIYSNVKLEAPQLKSVGGDLSISLKLDTTLEKSLWKNNKKKKWFLDNNCSEYLLSKKGDITHRINSIEFVKKLFDAIRKDKLSAQEVFQISNIEQRRVAYEFMDKVKMKKLPNYTVLDSCVDNHKNKMEIISFDIDDYSEKFTYLHCVCPSTKREYFIETQASKCDIAKSKSFGFNNIEFSKEW